ncbi:MAG TPA: mandelate racemase/muconate lactonizing enzyme family protein [Terriglobia bacterium]|nr:mandelate racemase/muconate lactonizing enzyme family protein [Terriglobia bacterium]
MRIVEFKTTIVSVPFKGPETWAFGKKFGISNVVIELKTDTGLVGLGEAVGFPSVRVVDEVLRSMQPIVLGRDPFDNAVLIHELTFNFGWHHFRHTGNCALAGIDMALWDLVGQCTREPLYKLFGGAFRKRIKYYWYVPDMELGAMAEMAKQGIEQGFDTVYVKLGRGFEHDLQVAQVVRSAVGPRAKLRVDANESWADGSALSIMASMSQYDIEFFEQPLLYYDHDGAASLRRALGLPVAANQSAWTEPDIVEIIKKGAADVILTDQHQIGSLMRLHRAAWMLAGLGIPVIKHSFGDLGISTAAAKHVMASCPNFERANQTHFGVLTDDIIVGGLETFRNGCLTLPEGPGLGVKLDPARVERYAEYYREQGEFSSYASGEDLVLKESQTLVGAAEPL